MPNIVTLYWRLPWLGSVCVLLSPGPKYFTPQWDSSDSTAATSGNSSAGHTVASAPLSTSIAILFDHDWTVPTVRLRRSGSLFVFDHTHTPRFQLLLESWNKQGLFSFAAAHSHHFRSSKSEPLIHTQKILNFTFHRHTFNTKWPQACKTSRINFTYLFVDL